VNPLSHDERRALGRAARQQLARGAHARFNPRACPTDPLAILADSMRGRVPHLIPLKYQRMAASAFGFFRGAVPIMAADLAAHPHTGLVTQLCGDAHVENLGAYAAPDGGLVFDINDFDETLPGPFEWDVKRLATSLILAGREAGIRRSDRQTAVSAFTGRYRRSMRRFAAMPVLELARYQINRLSHVDPMPAILAQAERSTPQKILEKLTQPLEARSPDHTDKPGKIGPAARRFRSDPPLLERVSPPQEAKVLAALTQYARTLQPERQHFLAQYTPVDVAFKVVGTGSVALRDFVVYYEGHTRPPHSDPLFLQMKEEPPSAYARFLPGAAASHHQGQRVMEGQRAMQLTSDPFLGYTTMDNRDFVVRQLNDHKAALDLKNLTAENLTGYADVCGELLARGHARAGDPVALHAYLGSSARFDHAIVAFAHACADKTERDWHELTRWLKSPAGRKAVSPGPPSNSKRSR
jgi:uncharacterized protein (DUF2252 family)